MILHGTEAYISMFLRQGRKLRLATHLVQHPDTELGVPALALPAPYTARLAALHLSSSPSGAANEPLLEGALSVFTKANMSPGLISHRNRKRKKCNICRRLFEKATPEFCDQKRLQWNLCCARVGQMRVTTVWCCKMYSLVTAHDTAVL